MILHKTNTGSTETTPVATPLRILVLLPVLDGNVLSKRKKMFDSFLQEIFTAMYCRVIQGEWEVDFLTFQSVAALRQKLNAHAYHILYLWGGGRCAGERAFWAFQNEATTEPVWLDAQVWIRLLQEADGSWRVPFVIASFFPETETSRSADFTEIIRFLHRAGVPAIISTGPTKSFRSAVRFVQLCLEEISAGNPVEAAFQAAQTARRHDTLGEDDSALATSHIPEPVLLQNDGSGRLAALWKKKAVSKLEDGPVVFPARSRTAVPLSLLVRDLAPVMAHELRDAVYSLEVKKSVHIAGCPEVTEGVAGALLQNFLQNHPEALAFCFRGSDRSVSDLLDTLKNCLLEMGKPKTVRIAEGIHNYLKQFIYLTSQLLYLRPVIMVFQNLDEMCPEWDPLLQLGGDIPPLVEIVLQISRGCTIPCIITTRPAGRVVAGAAHLQISQGDFSQFLKSSLMRSDPQPVADQVPPGGAEGKPRSPITRMERIFTACRGNPQAARAVLCATARFPGPKMPEDTAPQSEKRPRASSPPVQLNEVLLALSPQEQALLGILSEFRVPVSVHAVVQQFSPGEKAREFAALLEHQLQRLAGYHLIRHEEERSINEPMYHLYDVVRQAVKSLGDQLAVLPFSHAEAGKYYYEHFQRFTLSLTDLLEAYHHFSTAGDSRMATRIGRKIAHCLLKSEQYGPAEKWIRQLISARPQDSDRVTLLYYLGLATYKSGQWRKSLKILKLGIRFSERIPHTDLTVKFLYFLGEISLELKNWTEAELYFQKCRDLAPHGSGEISLPAIQYQWARIEFQRGNSALALKILDQCLVGAQKIQREDLIHKICQQVGEICCALRLWDKSLQYYQKSAQFSQKSQNLPQYARDLLTIGNLYTELGQDKNALEVYQKSLVMARDMGDSPLQCAILGHLTKIAERRNEFQLVVQYLTQMVQNYQQQGQPLAESRTLLRLGKILIRLRQNENALTVLVKSKEILEKYPFAPEASEACYLLGKLFKLFHQYEDAKNALKAGAYLAHRQGHFTRAALAICELSQMLYDQGRTGTAVSLLKKGVRLNRKHKDILGEAIQLLNLAKISGGNGNSDPKAVRAYYLRAKKLSRRLKSPRLQSEISQFSLTPPMKTR